MTPDPVTRAMQDIRRDFGVNVSVVLDPIGIEARAYSLELGLMVFGFGDSVPAALAALRTELQSEREDRG